jgi:hypothetical protein
MVNSEKQWLSNIKTTSVVYVKGEHSSGKLNYCPWHALYLPKILQCIIAGFTEFHAKLDSRYQNTMVLFLQ